MKIIKRNQIIIFVIALMLITAGYLNYTAGDGKSLLQASSSLNSEEMAALGDAKLVNSNPQEETENETETASSISSDGEAENSSNKEDTNRRDSPNISKCQQ